VLYIPVDVDIGNLGILGRFLVFAFSRDKAGRVLSLRWAIELSGRNGSWGRDARLGCGREDKNRAI